MSPASTAAIETYLRSRRSASAAEMQQALGLSQPTLSRALVSLGERVARLGRGRATRYALLRPLGHFGAQWPLYRIAADARATPIGSLQHLHGDALAFTTSDTQSAIATPLHAAGNVPDLPWFLDDQRPQGFLGRNFARRVASEIGAPDDPLLWRPEHVALAWLRWGNDLVGDFVLGDAMLDQVQRATLTEPKSIADTERGERYHELADAALAGDAFGSSAGGEHPKFTCCVRRGDASYHHVLVKFSEAQNTPAKRRWLDLLIGEWLASVVLGEHGIAGAASELVSSGERLCLEVERFDREAAHGRRGTVTLQAIDDVLYGLRGTWRSAADRLLRDRWITIEAHATLHVLHWFGGLIGNSDMHFGNASFFLGERLPLALAPSYDMLPMLYRPASSGEIVPRTLEVPLPTPGERSSWARAAAIATEFWQRLGSDARVSLPFRRIAAENLALVRRAREQFG